jgi:hypothetical protein
MMALYSSHTGCGTLDYELWRSADVDAVQQIPQSTGGDRSFISRCHDLIGVAVHLLLLKVAQRSVVFIIFILIGFFFFFLVVVFFLMIIVIVVVVVVFFLMIIVIVVVVIVAIVLRQLLSIFRCFLSFFSHKYHDHDLKGILLLRNVLS